MKYELRDYQREASDAAMRFFQSRSKRNGVIVLPTGSGKSLLIADIAHRLGEELLVFQPQKEILEQNFSKLLSYGETGCSVYSASLNRKEISRITFATIGSVMAHKEDFDRFRYVIVDEAHVTNPKGGMYKEFFDCADRKILGLTATPYRLTSALVSVDEEGRYDPAIMPVQKCMLKFITRTRPRIFHDVVYHVAVRTLLERGYLAKLNYYDLAVVGQERLKRNSTGMDYDEQSLFEEYGRVNLADRLADIVRRLQHPKSGVPRRGILVFTKFIDEAKELCRAVEGCAMVSGDMSKKDREGIIAGFRNGNVSVLVNVGVLTTGFDYPELDTVVLARPTMSLALYYQMVGRVIRPHADKESAWVVDLCGNVRRFGRVEDLQLTERSRGEYAICGFAAGKYRQLTNCYF